MKTRIIRSSDPVQDQKPTNDSIEKLNLGTFIPPAKLSEQVDAIRSEYDRLKKEIDEIQQSKNEISGRQGYEEGIAKGYEEGFQRGLDDGITKIREEESQSLDLLTGYLAQLNADKLSYIKEADKQMAELVIIIAKKVIQDFIEDKPDFVLSIIQQAVDKIPGNPDVTIHINPRDHESLERNTDFMNELSSKITNLQIEEDTSVSPGSCRISTTKGIVDADIGSQLNSIKEMLLESVDEPEEQNIQKKSSSEDEIPPDMQLDDDLPPQESPPEPASDNAS